MSTALPPPSIAATPGILERSSPLDVSSNACTETFQSARLRLLIAIPAATVLWALAAGVMGLHILRNYEQELDALAFNRGFVALAAGVIAVAGMAALTGLAVARSVLRPLAALARDVEALAEGMTPPPAALPVTNEVGELNAKFSAMLQALNARVQARSQLIMEHFAGALITVNSEGQISAANTEALRLFSKDREKLCGQPLGQLLHANGDKETATLIQQLLEGDEVSRRAMHLQVAGEVRELLVSSTTERDARGRATGTVLNFQDVSQIEAFHEGMRQSEQFAGLCTFAAGVAHEVRNPLASIKGIAQLLGEDAPSDERTARFTRVMTQEIDRLDEIVTELQAFTHLPSKARQACDLVCLVREAIALAVHRHHEEHGIRELRVLENLQCEGQVRAVPERLLQAVFHVIYNAFDHSGGTGEVWIRLSSEVSGEAVLEVENSGTAIAAEEREQIFTPFFTTKAAGPGLGLAVARQVVTQHQGCLELVSTSPHVCFRVRLPIIANPAQPASAPRPLVEEVA